MWQDGGQPCLTGNSTFDQYHVPGTSSNILDPLANIAAAINYAEHRYGPTLMRGGNGLGSGHGYAAGGSPVAGEWAWVGEQGPELAYFTGGGRVLSHADSVAAAAGLVPAGTRIAGLAAGTPRQPGDAALAQAGSLKSAVKGLEDRMDRLIKTTAGVGGDVAGSLNTTGRLAGHATAFGGGKR